MLPLLAPLAIAGGSALFSKLLNPGKGYEKAQSAAMPYYNQAQQQLKPYAQQGQSAYKPLQGAMQNLLNPEKLYNDWAGGYETSPYGQQMMDESRNQALEAASSQGLFGSTASQASAQRGATNAFNADRMNYLDQLKNLYFQGAGIGQNLYGQGAHAAGQLGNNAMNFGQMSGENAYGKQNAPGELFSNLLGKGISGYAGYQNMQAMNNMADAYRGGSYGAPFQNPYGGPGQAPTWSTGGIR